MTCNGQCTAVATDTNNCGACGRSCAPGTCSAGKCTSWVVVSTDATYFGCDGTEVAWAQPTITDLLEAPADGTGDRHSGSWFQASPGAGNGQVYGVAVSAGVTAWTATDPGGDGNALLAAASEGAYGSVVTAGLGTPTGVALDSSASNAYFGTTAGSTGQIWQCSLVGGMAPCVSLASVKTSQLASVAVDDAYVYWTDTGNAVVARKPLTGGAASTLASGQRQAGAIVVDASNVYWTEVEASKTVLKRMAKGATSAADLASSAGAISAMASDGTHLYFATADGSVQSIPVSGRGQRVEPLLDRRRAGGLRPHHDARLRERGPLLGRPQEPADRRSPSLLKRGTARPRHEPGTTTTPHGREPGGSLVRDVSFRDATSTIETSSDGPFATRTVFPSGVTATPQGRSPTAIEPVTSSFCGSTKSTLPPRPVVTKTSLPSGEIVTPIGRPSTLITLATA